MDWSARDIDLSWSGLKHLLMANDVWVAIILSARRHNYNLIEWIDERQLRRDHQKENVKIEEGMDKGKRKFTLIPDGYFVLEAKTPKHIFLEIDRATETGQATRGVKDWSRKIKAYIAYYNSGKYHARYQAREMQVLTVTTSETRLANLKRITEQVGGQNRFWFTTKERIRNADILTDPIWNVADRDDRTSFT